MAKIDPKEGVRYENTDAMRSEFGSYRVNGKTENLCDSSEVYPVVQLETPIERAKAEEAAIDNY